MTDYYMLNTVLGKIKVIIGINKFDDTKILIDTDNKLTDKVTLKNALMLKLCVIKNGDKFYLQIFLGEALVI